jgi:hypothetical protein
MRFESRILVLVVSSALSLWESDGSSPGGNPGAYNAGRSNYGQQQQYQQQQPNQGGWQRQDENYGNYQQSEVAPPQAESDELPPLPAGWSEHMDPSSGESYYFNASEGVTTWDRPVPEATPEAEVTPVKEEEEVVVVAPIQDVMDEVPVVERTDERHDGMVGSGHSEESLGNDPERLLREHTQQHAPVDDMRREDVPSQQKESEARPVEEQAHGWEKPTEEREAANGPAPGTTGWGMRREEQEQVHDRPGEQQKNEFKPDGGAPGYSDPRMQQRPDLRAPVADEVDLNPIARQPGGWGQPRTEQTREQPPAGWGVPREEEAMKEQERSEKPLDRNDPSQFRTPLGMKSPEPLARQPQPYQTKPLDGTQQEQSRPAQSQPEQHQQEQPRSSIPQHGRPMPGQQPPREDQRPPPQQYQQQPPQQQRPPMQVPPGQQQPPQQRAPGQGPPGQQQPPQQRPPQQYPPGPGQYSQPPQGNYQQQSQYGNSQYGQYGAPSQQGYGQPGNGQLTVHQPDATSAVRESLGTAWQGFLGFSNRTKDAVESARTTVVSGAKEASQSLTSTSASTSKCVGFAGCFLLI